MSVSPWGTSFCRNVLVLGRGDGGGSRDSDCLCLSCLNRETLTNGCGYVFVKGFLLHGIHTKINIYINSADGRTWWMHQAGWEVLSPGWGVPAAPAPASAPLGGATSSDTPTAPSGRGSGAFDPTLREGDSLGTMVNAMVTTQSPPAAGRARSREPVAFSVLRLRAGQRFCFSSSVWGIIGYKSS